MCRKFPARYIGITYLKYVLMFCNQLAARDELIGCVTLHSVVFQ